MNGVHSYEESLNQLLTPSGVELNGENPWDIRIFDDRWYGRVLRDKNLGLGEAYMEGWWHCDQLDEMFARILRSGVPNHIQTRVRNSLRLIPALVGNLQSKGRARIVARRHYDLGNDFFGAFLDPYWQYSCGYFERTDVLERAQEDKLALICRKLNLCAEDHLLDIGCGWGGLARYAAEHYGCRVTGINISGRQLEFAREFCRGLPIEFRDQDYRSIEGSFDKIVSVGMLEHVGYKNYRTFMKVVRRCLKRHGIFLLHTIGSNVSGTCCDPWINRYIFPNGMLPGLAQVAQASEKLFVLEDVHNIGPHYDPTLMAWNERFQNAWKQLSSRYDETFKRMWEYYLLSCAGAFRLRSIHLWQIVMTHYGSGTPQPVCRLPLL